MLPMTPWVLAIALAAAAEKPDVPGVLNGTFSPGEFYAAPEDAAPPRISRAHVQTVTLSGGRGSAEIRATARSELVIWMLPVSRAAKIDRRLKPALSLQLRAPSSGLIVPPAPAAGPAPAAAPLARWRFESLETGLDLPGLQEAMRLRAAEGGIHQLELRAEGSVDAAIVVAAEPTSPLTLSAWATPLSRRPGQPVVLSARILEGERPVSDARVVGRLVPPGKGQGEPVKLFDDGRHADGGPGDGLFAASIPVSDITGFWSVRFDAEGRTANGLAFGRTSSSGFMSERGAATLVPHSLRAQVVGQGTQRVLKVTASATVREAGAYRFDVIAAGPAGSGGRRAGVAWGERSLKLAPGQASLALDIPLPTGGPMPALVDVRLLDLGSLGLADRAVLQLE